MAEYRLTDEEHAEALRAGFKAAFDSRFVDGNADAAVEIGLQAGMRHANEIARRQSHDG